MASIFDTTDREMMFVRIASLRPESPALWGRMNVRQMVCHLTDSFASCFEPSPPPGAGLFSHTPFRQLVIYLLPWPKGKLDGPPALFRTQPGEWEEDVARLRREVERVARRGPGGEWPASEVFGHLTGREWGALLWKHSDHHLRQFGV